MHHHIHKYLHPFFLNPSERKMVHDLRSSIKSLAQPSQDFASAKDGAELAWLGFRKEIRNKIISSDPRYFLRWNVILHTMFYGGNDAEIEALKQDKDWIKWQSAISETNAGYPIRYKNYPLSGGNTIHHAYLLSQLFSSNKITVNKLLTIFEFGGGYGNTARLFDRIGFKGKYTIFDLPEFLLLQKFFFSLSCYKENIIYNNSNLSKTNFISDLEKIPNDFSPDLFLAAWSLSESPLDLREKILKKINSPKNIAIAYQQSFREIDNEKYFSQLADNMKNYEWTQKEIKHQPGNYFLFGKYKK